MGTVAGRRLGVLLSIVGLQPARWVDADQPGMALTFWAKQPHPPEAQPRLGSDQSRGGLIVLEPRSVGEERVGLQVKAAEGFHSNATAGERRSRVTCAHLPQTEAGGPPQAGAQRAWGGVHGSRPLGLLSGILVAPARAGGSGAPWSWNEAPRDVRP